MIGRYWRDHCTIPEKLKLACLNKAFREAYAPSWIDTFTYLVVRDMEVCMKTLMEKELYYSFYNDECILFHMYPNSNVFWQMSYYPNDLRFGKLNVSLATQREYTMLSMSVNAKNARVMEDVEDRIQRWIREPTQRDIIGTDPEHMRLPHRRSAKARDPIRIHVSRSYAERHPIYTATLLDDIARQTTYPRSYGIVRTLE